jgi:Flp pilus assembly protein TadD
MNRILTCPHCGPTLTEARLRCDRCGRELVSISEDEFSGRKTASEAPEQKLSAAQRTGPWIVVSAAVVVVVATAGLTLPGRQAPVPAPPDAPAAPTQQMPSAATAPPAELASQAEALPPGARDAAHKPGDLAHALEHYRAALAAKPADPELLANVGQILVAMNRPAEAAPVLEQAVEAEPFSITARFDLAVAYARSGNLQEAVKLYQALLQSDAADMRVQHNLGLALRQLGRNAEAAAAFERAAAFAPDQAPGWLGLALSLEADGRGGAAAAALERYLALEPEAPDADNVRARIARLRAAAEPSPLQPDGGDGTSRRRP